ncbi:hypothetical protein HUB94_17935 [Paenibacillus cellulosilyticus]|nr:hypothetical protein HUB94_17935 [Paenibacillus cellulosilyticus]
MFIVTLVFPLVGAERVYACSCAAYPDLSSELDAKSAVFAGEVTSMDTVSRGDVVSSADPVFVTFEVAKVWKGSIKKETVVRTVRDSASCGYEFSLGQSYLVFANEEDGVIRTGMCTGTQPLNDSSAQQLDDIVRSYDPQDNGGDTSGRVDSDEPIYDQGRQVAGVHQNIRPVDFVHEVGAVAAMHEDNESEKGTPQGYIFLGFAFVAMLSALVGFKIGSNRK